MRRIRSKNTTPEMRVRSLVFAMGYRYRLHRKDLPGVPDLVFPARRKVIFVHGCFWHLHVDPACHRANLPKSNTDYWKPKLERNRFRDEENRQKLRAMGWDVLVVWECEMKQSQERELQERLRQYLGD